MKIKLLNSKHEYITLNKGDIFPINNKKWFIDTDQLIINSYQNIIDMVVIDNIVIMSTKDNKITKITKTDKINYNISHDIIITLREGDFFPEEYFKYLYKSGQIIEWISFDDSGKSVNKYLYPSYRILLYAHGDNKIQCIRKYNLYHKE